MTSTVLNNARTIDIYCRDCGEHIVGYTANVPAHLRNEYLRECILKILPGCPIVIGFCKPDRKPTEWNDLLEDLANYVSKASSH